MGQEKRTEIKDEVRWETWRGTEREIEKERESRKYREGRL